MQYKGNLLECASFLLSNHGSYKDTSLWTTALQKDLRNILITLQIKAN